jgi:RNA:NAD 2'-phosphotransferase (TPT1/KptA family)
VVLEIDAAGMARAGRRLFRSAGGTWLTKEVPTAYIVRFDRVLEIGRDGKPE